MCACVDTVNPGTLSKVNCVKIIKSVVGAVNKSTEANPSGRTP